MLSYLLSDYVLNLVHGHDLLHLHTNATAAAQAGEGSSAARSLLAAKVAPELVQQKVADAMDRHPLHARRVCLGLNIELLQSFQDAINLLMRDVHITKVAHKALVSCHSAKSLPDCMDNKWNLDNHDKGAPAWGLRQRMQQSRG